MNKQSGVLIPFLAIGVVFWLGYQGFGWDNSLKGTEIDNILATFSVPDTLKREAWTTFENYLAFARTHNLSDIKSLSYQISATCSDPSKEKACFALMDSVYAIASPFELTDFKHIQADERQIIMYTDGPTVAILYFIRDEHGAPKVLGMRFCLEDKTTTGKCVETDPSQRDRNGNGWWDSVESLFY